MTFAVLPPLGFGLASLPIGVERGYVSSEEAKDRAVRALRTLERSNAHHRGMFCHFIDLKTGHTTPMGYESIASSVDTALMVAGAIVAGEYFQGEAKELAGRLFARVDWKSFVNPDNRPGIYGLGGRDSRTNERTREI